MAEEREEVKLYYNNLRKVLVQFAKSTSTLEKQFNNLKLQHYADIRFENQQGEVVEEEVVEEEENVTLPLSSGSDSSNGNGSTGSGSNGSGNNPGSGSGTGIPIQPGPGGDDMDL